jgi:hypothetical protein
MSGSPLLWKSHIENCISHSCSAEAKIEAMDECTKSIQWLCNILDDIDLLLSTPLLQSSVTTRLPLFGAIPQVKRVCGMSRFEKMLFARQFNLLKRDYI